MTWLAWLTDWPPESVPLLSKKLLEPPAYSAVMVCDPGARLVVVQVACPIGLSDTALQIADPPSLNVTVPSPVAGLPEPAPVPVTVAVKVTESPKVEGLTPAVRTIAVDVARLTLTPFVSVKVPEFWPAPHPSL